MGWFGGLELGLGILVSSCSCIYFYTIYCTTYYTLPIKELSLGCWIQYIHTIPTTSLQLHNFTITSLQQLHYSNHKSTQVVRSKMSFTKNLTRALNTTPLRQQRSTTTFPYATHEPLEYQLSRLSLSKIKQESARPEPDLRHVVGYASVNRAAGDKMYQNLVRGVELLRTERRAKYAAGRRVGLVALRMGWL
ncbi:hypothetical protein BDV34DRAFT_120391 [Aspergillus parasiticus]|uniref:Uncharacterized protein n=1 Tax=Aspergillus parasiticus TaxID=5067 RepID=A0A5N6DGE5_ASPPA|nr:hypothetical protein BDV34DRAFT_120391 [Aspergillus parasiticus]